MDEEIQHCGDCKHWHRQPSNIVDLSQIRGECRESPPSCCPIVSQQGKELNIMAWATAYPPLAPNNPACSRFAPQQELQQITGIRTGES